MNKKRQVIPIEVNADGEALFDLVFPNGKKVCCDFFFDYDLDDAQLNVWPNFERWCVITGGSKYGDNSELAFKKMIASKSGKETK